MAKFHRAFGVYGILIKQQQLVVVKRKDGPYKYRHDLPGGSLEPGEFLQNALIREAEETGLHVRDASQVGVTSFYVLGYLRILTGISISSVLGSLRLKVNCLKKFPIFRSRFIWC